jgi:colicin import membrane protein
VAPAPIEPVRPPPVVEPPAPPKADIVETKAPEPVRKVEPPKLEKKQEEKKKEEPKPAPKVDLKAEAAKREAADKATQARVADAQRQAAITRALAAAGGTPGGTPGTSPGGEPGLARGYEAQVIGCIRPHIVFSVPDGLRPKQHVAEFEVQLLPTGEQLGAPRLLKASGLGAYDQAVERAIRRCDPFPRPREGAMPRVLRLGFDPVELR